MGDDYKEKLKTFIADIPPFPGQIVSGESKRPPYDKEFKDKLADPKFTMPTTELFTKYTGTAHLTLIKNWSGGGIQTTCNEFVGKCGAVMGSKLFLGQFELEELLRKNGKSHAWVPANSGKYATCSHGSGTTPLAPHARAGAPTTVRLPFAAPSVSSDFRNRPASPIRWPTSSRQAALSRHPGPRQPSHQDGTRRSNPS